MSRSPGAGNSTPSLTCSHTLSDMPRVTPGQSRRLNQSLQRCRLAPQPPEQPSSSCCGAATRRQNPRAGCPAWHPRVWPETGCGRRIQDFPRDWSKVEGTKTWSCERGRFSQDPGSSTPCDSRMEGAGITRTRMGPMELTRPVRNEKAGEGILRGLARQPDAPEANAPFGDTHGSV